jgi:hypothetical protein
MSPGRTIWGITGIGTGGFEPKVAESGKTIVTTTRSHSNALVQSALDALQPDDVLRVGGAGHKVSLKNKFEPYHVAVHILGYAAIGRQSARLRVCQCWMQKMGHVCSRGHSASCWRPSDRHAGSTVSLPRFSAASECFGGACNSSKRGPRSVC